MSRMSMNRSDNLLEKRSSLKSTYISYLVKQHSRAGLRGRKARVWVAEHAAAELEHTNDHACQRRKVEGSPSSKHCSKYFKTSKTNLKSDSGRSFFAKLSIVPLYFSRR